VTTGTMMSRALQARRVVAVVVGCVVGVTAAYFLIVGVRVQVATISGGPSFERQRQVSALIPLIGSAVYLVGIHRLRRRWALGGALLTLIYGILFLFSVGPYYAPMGLLMVGAAVWVTPRRVRPG
jgi:hypothetical protein